MDPDTLHVNGFHCLMTVRHKQPKIFICNSTGLFTFFIDGDDMKVEEETNDRSSRDGLQLCDLPRVYADLRKERHFVLPLTYKEYQI